eukprot:4043164-Pyramimonas_sp.AAC.1
MIHVVPANAARLASMLKRMRVAHATIYASVGQALAADGPDDVIGIADSGADASKAVAATVDKAL